MHADVVEPRIELELLGTGARLWVGLRSPDIQVTRTPTLRSARLVRSQATDRAAARFVSIAASRSARHARVHRQARVPPGSAPGPDAAIPGPCRPRRPRSLA